MGRRAWSEDRDTAATEAKIEDERKSPTLVVGLFGEREESCSLPFCSRRRLDRIATTLNLDGVPTAGLAAGLFSSL